MYFYSTTLFVKRVNSVSSRRYLLFTICYLLINGAAAHTGSVNPFLIMFGNLPRCTQQDIPLLADYELLIFDRMRFKQINNNTWKAIKTASPSTKILLYQAGPLVANNTDSKPVYYLNNLGRYDVSRGSSDGNLNKDHPDWFLKNVFGKRVNFSKYPANYYLDFGNAEFVDYWIKHSLEDISFQKWRADGIFVDEAAVCRENKLKYLTGYTPEKYRDCKNWDKAMNDYLATASAAIHKQNQLFAANRGHSRYEAGTKAWLELDKIKAPLDMVLEEGAFSVSWGGGDVLFFPVEEWKRQIDLPASIKQSAIGMISHTNLALNNTGTAANGEKVTHDQVLRFSIGSYLLSRNLHGPTTYFMFIGNKEVNGYNKLIPTEMYSKFDIGAPLGKYRKAPKKEIYLRQYTDGYVYVNPTDQKIENISLAPDFHPRTDNKNVKKDGQSWYLDLNPHDAAIISKTRNAGLSEATRTRVLPTPPHFNLQ